jgi:hypothetical protein
MCISLATYNRVNDEIDGFCGQKGDDASDHKCNFNVIVSAASYESIIEAFRTQQIADMARLIVCNPLVKGFPRLVYAMLPTCNRFDASEVQAQWDQIHVIHDKYLSATVGPLVAHASDGDARRRKVMTDSIRRGLTVLTNLASSLRERLRTVGRFFKVKMPHILGKSFATRC